MPNHTSLALTFELIMEFLNPCQFECIKKSSSVKVSGSNRLDMAHFKQYMEQDSVISRPGHKIDDVAQIKEIQNVEGHHNHIVGSKVIFLNRWIWPIGVVALGRVCTQPAKQAYFITNIDKLKHCLQHCPSCTRYMK